MCHKHNATKNRSEIIIINTDVFFHRYRRKIKDLRTLMLDEPMPPMEKAIWWIEYVIRHKGTKHLRSPTIDISWIEYFLIDIISVVVLISVVIVCLTFKIIKVVRNCKTATSKTKRKSD